MKHIFLIHSHITREVAWAIIRRERITPNDVVFLLDRKFETSEDGIRVAPLDLPDEYFLIYKNPLRGWRHLRQIRQFIDDLSPAEFVCYFPHTYSEFANLAVSHPRCRGYSLMEEGLWSYFSVDKMNDVVPPVILGWKQRLLSRVFYLGRFKDRFFCKDDYLSVYCTSEKAFPGFAKKVVVDLAFPGVGDEVIPPPGSRKVIVLDSVVETRVVSEHDFMAGFDQLLEKLTERLGESEIVYLKRHPYQYVTPEFSDRLIAYLRKKIPAHEVQELAGEVSLEKMALTGGAEFYLNVSSVSIYASRLGSKVYSYARSIGRSSPEFMRRLERLPQVFHESVEFI
jgi:hypothetical protein